MKKLDIDFADHGVLFWLYRADLRLWSLSLVTCFVLMAAWLEWSSVHSALDRLAQERAQMVSRQERHSALKKPRPSAASGLTAEQVKASNAVIRQLNQPWTELLETLESTQKGRVALLELRFDPLRNRVKGVAEAKNSIEMLRFITQMKAQPLLGKVELSLHQISQTDPNKPYRFEFSADWREEGGQP